METKSEDLDDNHLMSRVISGEIDRAAILYEKYKMPLYAYFYKVTCCDKQASEDLVHTVFYRMIRYRSGFRGEGSFAKWLFRIAHNAAVDHVREIKRINNYKIENIAQEDDVPGSNETEKREQMELLGKAMTFLKPGEREVLVLGKIECLRYVEIAGILNTTEGNVKIRIFRALKKLREIYEKLETAKYEKSGSGKKNF